MWSKIFQDPVPDLYGDLLLAMDGKPTDAATLDGGWMNVQGYDKISVHVIIPTTGTVQICGSNEHIDGASGPDNDGYQLFPDITSSQIVSIKTPLKWLKAKVTANGGQIQAPFIAV